MGRLFEEIEQKSRMTWFNFCNNMNELKKIPNFRLFTIFCLSFLLGIFASSFLKIDFNRSLLILLVILAAFLFAAFFNFVYKNYLLTIISFCFIFILLGIGYYFSFESKNAPTLVFDQEQEITAKIIKKPELGVTNQKAIAKVINSGESRCVGNNVLINLPHYPSYQYGDTIKFIAKIEKPGKIDDFDYERYLKAKLVFGLVKYPKNIEKVSSDLSFSEKVYKSLYSVSIAFENSLNRILPEPQASLSAGLILGIKRNIPDTLNEALSVTGLTHIIALSGYNVTIIIIVLTDLLIGYIGRKNIFILGGSLIVGFVILTGAASSVVRAAIFSLMIIFGKTIGRRGDLTNLMLLAALVMILINPFSLRSDIGFQLSFLAFSGLIYLSPIIEKLFNKCWIGKIQAWIREPFRETLAAQIAVFPLILTVFGRVSIIGPLSNLVVLWIVPWTMAVSFVVGLLGIIFYPLGKIAALIAWPALEYVIKSVEYMAKIPGASFSVQKGVWAIELLLYFLLIFGAIFLCRKFKLKY